MTVMTAFGVRKGGIGSTRDQGIFKSITGRELEVIFRRYVCVSLFDELHILAPA